MGISMLASDNFIFYIFFVFVCFKEITDYVYNHADLKQGKRFSGSWRDVCLCCHALLFWLFRRTILPIWLAEGGFGKDESGFHCYFYFLYQTLLLKKMFFSNTFDHRVFLAFVFSFTSLWTLFNSHGDTSHLSFLLILTESRNFSPRSLSVPKVFTVCESLH